MIVIGLTGGIATGKSAAAEALRLAGYSVVDCDKLGHDVYSPGTREFDAVVAVFGNEVVGAHGQIDRAVLGASVFGDHERMRQLTDITWPAIERKMLVELDSLRNKGPSEIVFVEAAVLVEAGWNRHVDEVWCLWADREKAIARVVARSGGRVSASQAAQRVDAQPPLEERLPYCHVLISNGNESSIGVLENRVLSLAEERRTGGRSALVRQAGPASAIILGKVPPEMQPSHSPTDSSLPGDKKKEEETIVEVDEANRVVGYIPRSVMRRENRWHRASYVFVRDGMGRILVHRRTASKDYCPSHWDTCAGGVVSAGEEDDMAGSAARELDEELGLQVPIEPLGDVKFESDRSRCWGSIFEANIPSGKRHTLRLQPEEVARVEWMTPEDVYRSCIGGTPWTADGIAVLREYEQRRDSAAAGKSRRWVLVAGLVAAVVGGLVAMRWSRQSSAGAREASGRSGK